MTKEKQIKIDLKAFFLQKHQQKGVGRMTWKCSSKWNPEEELP